MKKLIKLAAYVITGAALLFWIGCSEKSDIEAVRKVVTAYCQFDFEGARLSGSSTEKFESLVGYPDEPGWDRAVVVRGFKISRINVGRNKATAHVEYGVVGVLEGAEAFTPLHLVSSQELAENHIKDVTVELKKEKGGWKLADCIVLPRVSMQRMMAHLDALYAEEQNQSRRPVILKTMKDMKMYSQ